MSIDARIRIFAHKFRPVRVSFNYTLSYDVIVCNVVTGKRDFMVTIKGINDGLHIALDTEAEWNVVTAELASRIDQQLAFYAGAKVTLDVGTRPARKDELTSVKALFERRGLTLACVQSESATALDAAAALDLRTIATSIATGAPTSDGNLAFSSEEDGTPGVLVRRTLRSGRTVHSRGHVVIYGDVNAGAEVVAGGDVIVWGRLRGNVHAGADGDTEAIVCALDMTPTQLRIASLISTSPPDKRHKAKPEMALVRDGRIMVEGWE
jgi:septum site-determining protein MinC